MSCLPQSDEPWSPHIAIWQMKPLCTRYAFASFRTLGLPVRDGDSVKRAGWHWALGLFQGNAYEVLGAWPATAAPDQAAQDLHARGVEQIMAISTAAGIDCASRYPGAVTWPAPPAGTFGPRPRAAIESALKTASRLQNSLTASIRHRAPFANDAAAQRFLTLALEKADRRFFEAPKARVRPARLPAIPAAGGPAATSHGF